MPNLLDSTDHHSLDVAALFLSGVAQLRRSEMLAAATLFQRVLRLQPLHAEAWNNLGVILARHSRIDPAITSFQQALHIKPDYQEAARNLQQALNDQQRQGGPEFATAAQPFQHQHAVAEIYYSRAIDLISRHQPEQAQLALHASLSINPDFALAHYALAAAYAEVGQLEKALASLERTLVYTPQAGDVRYARARLWLQLGDYSRGWAEHEFRWHAKGFRPRVFQRPMWDGSPLSGRRILVHAEQGIGDTIQFIRYAPLLKQLGGEVWVSCSSGLHSLLRTCAGIDQLVEPNASLTEFDVHAPLMSLPWLCQTTMSTIPATVPYLWADPCRIELWKNELAPARGFKIGISWQGGAKYTWDYHRSIPLKHFEHVARVPGVRLICLQQGSGLEQLESIPSGWPWFAPGRTVDDSADAFVETAAVMLNLDLVIACDSACAHLAGALGVPVWLPLSVASDWRWFHGRTDSPWYPTMRLFRQSRLDDWEDVFCRVGAELRRLNAL